MRGLILHGRSKGNEKCSASRKKEDGIANGDMVN
jgi:hypothetical protein